MTRGLSALTACFAAALAAGGFPAQAATIKNASVQFLTGEDAKDASTSVSVTVSDADGKILERIFDGKQMLRPDTTFTVWLNCLRAEDADRLREARITVQITSPDQDRWVVRDLKLQVNYDSRPGESWHWGPFALEATHAKPATAEFTLSEGRRQ